MSVIAGLPPHVQDVVLGDLVVALAVRTPSGGVVVQPLANATDESGVRVTTSLGQPRKLERIAADGRVAVAFHARDHAAGSDPAFVLVQGRATITDGLPAQDLPAGLRGWLLREERSLRASIEIAPRTILSWPDVDGTGPVTVHHGDPAPNASTEPVVPPGGGVAARIRPAAYAERLRPARHVLVGWVGAGGFPMLAPVTTHLDDGGGLVLRGDGLPDGSCRMGLLAHWFDADLVGRGSVVMTGWFDARQSRYAPHTETGHVVMPSRWAHAIGVGLASKRGYRRAVRAGLVAGGRWLGGTASGGPGDDADDDADDGGGPGAGRRLEA